MIQEFVGNTDRDTVVYHKLDNAIRSRYIRFRPTAWHLHISMRVEVYGCQGIDVFLFFFCYDFTTIVFVLAYCKIFLLHSVFQKVIKFNS